VIAPSPMLAQMAKIIIRALQLLARELVAPDPPPPKAYSATIGLTTVIATSKPIRLDPSSQVCSESYSLGGFYCLAQRSRQQPDLTGDQLEWHEGNHVH
jgi:hypothetical protein